MPKIFEKDGFRFFFDSDDHSPIHVHVRYAGGEAIFVVGEVVELRDSKGFKVADLSKAQALTEENKELIVSKWNEHLG